MSHDKMKNVKKGQAQKPATPLNPSHTQNTQSHTPLETPLDMPMAAPGFSSSRHLKGWTTQSTQAAVDRAVMEATLGQVLQQARKDAGFSGTKLGEQLGISKARVSQLEQLSSGKVELQTVIQVARALGYDVKLELIPQSEDKPTLTASF